MDTEADSLHAYPEKLCLLQFSIEDQDQIIDPLAPIELAPLWKCLKGRELLFHGADYDLRLLKRTFNFIPEKIFDTMIAARLLGVEKFGLGNLVEDFLGITLEKGSQKANWARRPLTPTMEDYARNDTRHLKPLVDTLQQQLAEKGRTSWQEESCARLVSECSQPKEPDLASG